MDSIPGEDWLEKWVSKLRLLYKNCWKVLVSAGTSSQAAEKNPRVCVLESQILEKESKRATAVAFVDVCELVLGALRLWCVELGSNVTRLHIHVDAAKQLCAEVAGLNYNAEKVACSLTAKAIIRDEAADCA